MYLPTVDGDAMVQTIDATVCDPAVLTAALQRITAGSVITESGDRISVVGDGARRYADQLEAVPGVRILGPEHDHPSASALIAVAASRPALAADKVTPYYLRGPDVRIGWTRRDG
jgi:hypothetical protein